MAVSFTLNGKAVQLNVPNDMPLLWAIRDIVGLTGTKFGCGMAQCGACTVHVDGEPVRSCSLPVSDAKGKKVTTIEGIASKPAKAPTRAATFIPLAIITRVILIARHPGSARLSCSAPIRAELWRSRASPVTKLRADNAKGTR